MGYVGLNSNRIHVIDQVSLMNTMDAKVNQSVLKTSNSNFVQQNTNDDSGLSHSKNQEILGNF